MSNNEFRFSGISRLYGSKAESILENAHICVVGIGGVGTWSVEALARSGVGELTLVDLDDICVTNVNRQLHALDGEIGNLKVSAMAKRCKLINPNIKVNEVADFFTKTSSQEILSTKFDFVIDAIDSLENKAILVDECLKRNLKIVTVGGAGGKQDPTKVMVEDLANSWNDRLLQRLRKKLRGDFNFPRGDESFGVFSVFSPELPFLQNEDGTVCQSKKEEQKSYRLDCYTGYGSSSPVTGTFGLVAANVAIKELVNNS
jgi:tRNA A37 threonylcarbamoyladenosine dehydratase